MFNNLIESSSHLREYKRRGSFLLFTATTYVVLFVVTGVVSIYAYDARLENQTEELFVTLLPPMPAAEQPAPAAQPDRPRDTRRNERDIDIRSNPMASVNVPQVAPPNVSTTPNKNPPVPDNRPWAIGDHDFVAGPSAPGGPVGTGGGGRQVQTGPVAALPDDPPPQPAAPPKPPQVVRKDVINSEAISLPKPIYSEIAKRLRIQGSVRVQVLVDEQGRVVSAKALSGSPFLIPEAQKAALQARFSPTLLGGQPVKVSGLITYNFVLSN